MEEIYLDNAATTVCYKQVADKVEEYFLKDYANASAVHKKGFEAGKILKETKEALEQAARAGIEIVPATGRPFCGISDEIYRLDGVRYVLTTNGAGIYERDSKTCLYEDAIPLSAYLPMLAEVEAYDVMADTFLKGGALMTKRKRDLLPRMRLTK